MYPVQSWVGTHKIYTIRVPCLFHLFIISLLAGSSWTIKFLWRCHIYYVHFLHNLIQRIHNAHFLYCSRIEVDTSRRVKTILLRLVPIFQVPIIYLDSIRYLVTYIIAWPHHSMSEYWPMNIISPCPTRYFAQPSDMLICQLKIF